MSESETSSVGDFSCPKFKIVTTYSYTNSEVKNDRYAKGFLYHDASTNKVQWQCAGIITPWHGSWKDGYGSIEVRFHCLAGTVGFPINSIRLKSSRFFKVGNNSGAGNHEFEGLDDKGRKVFLLPLARWCLFEKTDSWKKVHQWNAETHQWEDCE